MSEQAEKEFEEWWKKEYRNYNCMASLTNIAFTKEAAKKSWLESQRRFIAQLKEDSKLGGFDIEEWEEKEVEG
jgi:hypothetical protein